MRVVLLANGWVGLQVARYLREQDPPVGLVLHETANASLRDEITTASGVGADDILVSERPHEPEPLAQLEAWAPDLLVSAWYGSILKREVLAVAPWGGVNLHPSYLPYGRGKFPNVWSIIEGTPAGATIHFMDEGIDTGDIIKRKEVPVGLVDTGATLYEKLQRACVEVFIEAWPDIRAGTAPRIAQSALSDRPTFHRARDVEGIDAIDKDATYVARDLINLLRARTFKPHPSAYISVDGRRISLRLELSEHDEPQPATSAKRDREGT